jgi:hypothetical protein
MSSAAAQEEHHGGVRALLHRDPGNLRIRHHNAVLKIIRGDAQGQTGLIAMCRR